MGSDLELLAEPVVLPIVMLMAYLRYVDDGGRLQVKTLDSEHFVIGRAATCQLVFDSDMVSREHARIDLEPSGRYRLHDLGSRNRTYVNGELVRDTLLTPGSILRIGEFLMEYVDDGAVAEKTDLEFLTPDRQEPPDCDWIKSKAPLSLTVAQVEQLAGLFSDQPLTARSEDIADAALGQIVLEVQGERGFVALRGEGKTDLKPLTHRSMKRGAGESMTPVSQTFIHAPLLQGVSGRYPQTTGQLNGKLGYAASAMVAPLLHRGEVIGVLYVDRPQARKPFPPAALQFFAAAGAQLGAMLGETQRKLTQAAGREGAAWLATIRRLQSLLSGTPKTGDAFDTAMKLLPGRLRCGDFASAVPLDEQRCGIVVVDGGGHGVTGIVQSIAVRTAIDTALATSDDALMDPANLFNALNRTLASSGARQALPCTFVGLDMSAGKAAYVNAGGMAPILAVGPGRLVTLDQVSLVLGVDADYLYQTTRVELPETFRLICHTDGLTEATSAAGEAFGDQRLHETLLEREAFHSAADMAAKITQAWTTHMAAAQAEDDAVLLVVARG